MATKKVNRSRAGNIILLIFLLGVSAFMLLPLVYAVSSSLKPMSEFWLFPPTMFPSNPTFDNYKNLVSVMSDSWVPFSRYAFNTLFITVVGTGGHIILSSMCAFSICKLKFPGHQVAFKMIVYSLMFNAAVTAIPNFLVINALGLIDKYSAIILPALGSSLGLYIMKQFMSQIPDALIESAQIDGASPFKTFWRIIMPNVKPAWLTLAIFSFQGLWNNANSTYIYREELKSLPYALNQISTGGIIRTGATAAVSVIILIVPLLLFIFTQSRIIETMATSGMKD